MEHSLGLDLQELGLRSLPYWVVAVVFVAMLAYVALARGAPALRYSFIGICTCILPFVVGYAIASSTTDMKVATVSARVGTAFTPLAGAFVFMFDVALTRRLSRFRYWLIAAFVTAVAFAVVSISTDWVTDGVWMTPAEVPFGTSGPLGWMSVALIAVFVVAGTFELWRQLAVESSSRRQRQFRGAIWAFSIAALGSVDLLLSYKIGYGPLSWFFLTVGALIALRSLATDELVGVATIDRRTLRSFGFLVALSVGAWFLSGAGSPGLVVAGVVLLFVGLSAAAAMVGFFVTLDANADSPLERALERYRGRLRQATGVEEVSTATSELLELALGCKHCSLLVPSSGDYSWYVAGGDSLIEDATPDPRLLNWFVTHDGPVARDDIVTARLDDLREPMEWLFGIHKAELIVPLVSGDELVGLVIVDQLTGGRSARPAEIELLERMAEQAAAAVVYSAMFREANERVEVNKEVELAGAVQEAFIPEPNVLRRGHMLVTGRYAPASRCGGDWWSAHQLSKERTLVLVGDVTGHGVAAAMVTAAAKGCCDVALRLMGAEVDLAELMQLLQGAVLRTGGDEFYMTCFATLVDSGSGTVRFANAGHVVPYLCKRDSQRPRLDVLVARGNPLGALGDPTYQVHEREIGSGDVLVWYTDGIVECTNPEGQQLGDRRFQRMVRRVASDAKGSDLDRVCDGLMSEAYQFQDGYPPADDITLVIGRVD